MNYSQSEIMISWSSKIDIVGYSDNFLKEDCRICSVNAKPFYKVEQSYFALYGLPLFPTKRIVYKTCNSCNAQLKVKSTDSNLHSLSNEIPFKLKFKYVWGWIILTPILVGIISFVFWIKNNSN